MHKEIIDKAIRAICRNRGAARADWIAHFCGGAKDYVLTCLHLESIAPNPRIVVSARGNLPEFTLYKLG